MKRPMTPKRKRFADEYLIDLNAARAYRAAGYRGDDNVCAVEGHRLLSIPNVAHYIKAAMDARNERTQIDADYVLNRLVEIDQMDVLDIMGDDMSLKPVSDWPAVWRRYLSGFDVAEMFEGRGEEREMVGILKKIKWPDKVKNLELLGKHVGVQAFKDRIEHSGEMTLNVLPEDAGL